MIGWLTAKSLLGAPRWLFAIAALAALGWALAALVGAINHHDAAQRKAGVIQEQAHSMGETIKRTEQGNAAREEIRRPDSSAKYDQCLRSARNPANCQRFVPERSPDIDRTGTQPRG